jgi:hypothetical protein
MLIYAHTISRIIPPCDISLGWLMFCASEAGDLVELLLLYRGHRPVADLRSGNGTCRADVNMLR